MLEKKATGSRNTVPQHCALFEKLNTKLKIILKNKHDADGGLKY